MGQRRDLQFGACARRCASRNRICAVEAGRGKVWVRCGAYRGGRPSLGGWLAFMIGAEDPRIGAVVGIAAWNPVIDVTKAEKDSKQRAAMIAGLDEFDADSGPLRGNSAM